MRLPILRGLSLIGYFLLGEMAVCAQISPVEVGQSYSQVTDSLFGEGAEILYESISQTPEKIEAIHRDEFGYKVHIITDFENSRCTKTLVEWKATHQDYRIILRKWFEEVVSMMNDEANYQRDEVMEKQLQGSYAGGRSRVAVFVAEDLSERIILVFYAKNDQSFLSQMHQVYFWPEELED